MEGSSSFSSFRFDAERSARRVVSSRRSSLSACKTTTVHVDRVECRHGFARPFHCVDGPPPFPARLVPACFRRASLLPPLPPRRSFSALSRRWTRRAAVDPGTARQAASTARPVRPVRGLPAGTEVRTAKVDPCKRSRATHVRSSLRCCGNGRELHTMCAHVARGLHAFLSNALDLSPSLSNAQDLPFSEMLGIFVDLSQTLTIFRCVCRSRTRGGRRGRIHGLEREDVSGLKGKPVLF